MSNYASTSVCIKGEKEELRSLYETMVQFEKNEKPLVENGFNDCNRWLGNLVHFLGGDYQAIDCRGTWSNLHLGNDCLSFDCETACCRSIWRKRKDVNTPLSEKGYCLYIKALQSLVLTCQAVYNT